MTKARSYGFTPHESRRTRFPPRPHRVHSGELKRGQVIDLLYEQRVICDAMEREIREVFASHAHKLQERLLESLDGAGGHSRLWWEIYPTGSNRH